METPAGSFECYLVQMNVEETGTSGTLFVRTNAPHYVVKAKLEQSTPRGSRTITQTLSSMDMGSDSSSPQ